MSDLDDKFPDWNKPATKGDVIRAMIYIRSCTVDLFAMATASQRKDHDEIARRIERFGKNDKDLAQLIDDISGRPRT